MKLEFSDLSNEGLIMEPRFVAGAQAPSAAAASLAQSFLDTDRDGPEIIGTVPNLVDFSTGEDCNVGAFEIKAQQSRLVCVPKNLAHLLPTTALIIDDFYRHAGPAVADLCQISLQFFRSSYDQGQHLLFDRIHRHATEGKMVIYVVTAIDAGNRGDPEALGTEFYAPRVMGQRISRARCATSAVDFEEQFASAGVVAAPGGAIIRFSETTLHAAPDITYQSLATSRLFNQHKIVRRSLLNIIASYKLDDGTVYGRSRPPNDHRESPVVGVAEKQGEYRQAAERILAEIGTPPGPMDLSDRKASAQNK